MKNEELYYCDCCQSELEYSNVLGFYEDSDFFEVSYICPKCGLEHTFIEGGV